MSRKQVFQLFLALHPKKPKNPSSPLGTHSGALLPRLALLAGWLAGPEARKHVFWGFTTPWTGTAHDVFQVRPCAKQKRIHARSNSTMTSFMYLITYIHREIHKAQLLLFFCNRSVYQLEIHIELHGGFSLRQLDMSHWFEVPTWNTLGLSSWSQVRVSLKSQVTSWSSKFVHLELHYDFEFIL